MEGREEAAWRPTRSKAVARAWQWPRSGLFARLCMLYHRHSRGCGMGAPRVWHCSERCDRILRILSVKLRQDVGRMQQPMRGQKCTARWALLLMRERGHNARAAKHMTTWCDAGHIRRGVPADGTTQMILHTFLTFRLCSCAVPRAWKSWRALNVLPA
jgi:hypothetical protein